jgi:transcriptional regulator GlxA family with amidase domain
MAYLTQGVFEQVQSRLRTHPSSSLADLCHSLNMERHTIERAVRTITGKCFREFRREALFWRARDLLRCEPGKSTKEIAFTLGFRSTRSFDRFIVTTCGRTPTQLRKELTASTPRRPK